MLWCGGGLGAGKTKQSNIRVEIEGIHAIQQYCKLDTINTNKISPNFVQKYNPIMNDERIKPVDINHYNLRAGLQIEKIIDSNSSIGENLKSN